MLQNEKPAESLLQCQTLVTLTDMDVSFTKDESDRLDRHLNETQVSQLMEASLVYLLIPIIYQNNADGKCVYLQMVCSV